MASSIRSCQDGKAGRFQPSVIRPMSTKSNKIHPFSSEPPPDDGGPSSELISGVFLFIAFQFAVDLVWDKVEGDASPLHLGVEALTGTVALVLAIRLIRTLRRRTRTIARLRSALQTSQKEADRWRSGAAQVLQGLAQALDLQFERWSLSQAERDVALLLLKGFSTRDIAQLRSTSERTVRQQAQDVYRKAGLSGRAELSAFFLEDLLLPPLRE